MQSRAPATFFQKDNPINVGNSRIVLISLMNVVFNTSSNLKLVCILLLRIIPFHFWDVFLLAFPSG